MDLQQYEVISGQVIFPNIRFSSEISGANHKSSSSIPSIVGGGATIIAAALFTAGWGAPLGIVAGITRIYTSVDTISEAGSAFTSAEAIKIVNGQIQYLPGRWPLRYYEDGPQNDILHISDIDISGKVGQIRVYQIAVDAEVCAKSESGWRNSDVKCSISAEIPSLSVDVNWGE